MSTAAITILGLGPGRWDDLTLQAHELLAQSVTQQHSVHFRTFIHPTVDQIRLAFPDLSLLSFDHLYDESENWETLYQQIASEVCAQATKQPVIYAVPGHPLIGETSVQHVLQMAREQGLTTTIVAGLSFLEPTFTALELDPFASGTQILDATVLAALDTTEVGGKVIPTIPLLVTQVYNRRVASAVKLALSEIYPDEWKVKLVRAAGVDSEEAVEEMSLFELDRRGQGLINHLCTLYVPPLDELTALRLPETLRYIIMRLRREPDGCPWDRKQTHQTLIRYVIEEAYEVVEALEENNLEKLPNELGDLLLQVYLHAEIARQSEEFNLGDVFEEINAKMIRRHPHVFGEVEVDHADQVIKNWEEIKRQERIDAGKDLRQESALDNIPQAQPAIVVAQEYQKRAIKAGFNFQNVDDLLAKLNEEIEELKEATTPEHKLEEFGDLLWMLIRLAQSMHVDAEQAIRSTNRKFRQRFQHMEEQARNAGRTLASYTVEEQINLWKQAKVELKETTA